MVMAKKSAATNVAETKFPGRRLLKSLDTSVGGSRSRVSMLFKPVRRSDQRSAVSIAGSCGSRSVADSNDVRSTPRRAAANCRSVGSLPSTEATGSRRPAKASPATPPIGSSPRSGGRFGFLRANTGASNSAGAVQAESCSPVDCISDQSGQRTDGRSNCRSSRRSIGTHKLGKSVSITASQEARTRLDIDRTANNRFHPPSEMTTKSIIKLRPLPPAYDELSSAHNTSGATKDQRLSGGPTPHQLREQKIFGECRFIPSDTFYKKVLVAPKQERQFFAAPKSIRGPGSRLFYDITGDNSRHHQDCNIDFVRDTLKRACSTYCRPSQFRHIY